MHLCFHHSSKSSSSLLFTLSLSIFLLLHHAITSSFPSSFKGRVDCDSPSHWLPRVLSRPVPCVKQGERRTEGSEACKGGRCRHTQTQGVEKDTIYTDRGILPCGHAKRMQKINQFDMQVKKKALCQESILPCF